MAHPRSLILYPDPNTNETGPRPWPWNRGPSPLRRVGGVDPLVKHLTIELPIQPEEYPQPISLAWPVLDLDPIPSQTIALSPDSDPDSDVHDN